MAPVRSVFVVAACAGATRSSPPWHEERVPLASPMHMSAPAQGPARCLQFPGGARTRLSRAGAWATSSRRRTRRAARTGRRPARGARREVASRERKRKIDFAYEMDENTPAGTVNDYMYKGNVTEILEQLDHDLSPIPVFSARDRVAACARQDAPQARLRDVGAFAAHVLHGRRRHRQDDRRGAHGGDPARMGYCRHRPRRGRDARRPGRPVRRRAPKTKEVVKRAMGGVLLVDEAYYLYNAANDRDYGQESIEILLNVMENNKEDLIVVLAGYKDRMDTFFSFIPGMSSRIGNRIDFPNYEANELTDIGVGHGPRPRVRPRPAGAIDMFQKYITKPHDAALLLERAHRAQREGMARA